MLPPVCLSPRNVKGSLICSLSSGGMKLKNVSGIYRTFQNEDRWNTIQTITKRCQFSCRWYNFPSKRCNFLPRGDIVRNVTYGEKMDKYALFLPKLFAHTPSYWRLKKAKHRLFTCRHPGTRRLSLHPISDVRNSVPSRMQRVLHSSSANWERDFNLATSR